MLSAPSPIGKKKSSKTPAVAAALQVFFRERIILGILFFSLKVPKAVLVWHKISFYPECFDMIQNPAMMVNDNAVDFGLLRTFFKLSSEIQAKFHVFSTHFLTKLMEIPSGQDGYDIGTNYSMVKRWTKKVDIFSKEYLVMPRFQARHFSYIMIVRPGLVEPTEGTQVKTEEGADMPCLLHLDPYEGDNKGSYHDGDELAIVIHQ